MKDRPPIPAASSLQRRSSSLWRARVAIWVLAGLVLFLLQWYYRTLRTASFVQDLGDWLLGMGGAMAVAEMALWFVYRAHAEQRRAQEYLDIADVIFLVLRPDGTVAMINRKGCDLIGRDETQVVDRHWFDNFLPSSERAAARKPFERLLRDGADAEEHFEAPVLVADGTRRLIAWHMTALVDRGLLSGILGSGVDITERRRAEEDLRENQRMLSNLLGNLPGMVFRCCNDRDWTMVFASDGCRSITGYEPDDLVGNSRIPYAELIHPDDREDVWRQVQEAVERRRSFQLVYRLRTAEGEEKWAWEQGSGVYDDAGRIIILEGFIADLTDLKRTEEALQESQRLFSSLAETVSTAIFITQGGRYRYVNAAAEKIFGYRRDELLKMDFLDVVHPDSHEEVRERTAARLRGEPVPRRYEVKYVSREGREGWLDFSASVIEFEGEPAVLGSALDITERKEAEAMIARLAYRDTLTGLPNRTLFRDRLGVALERARRYNLRLAVMMLDIDGFKEINDTLGHDVGDHLLHAIGGRLQSLLRKSDTVGRMGGDEFTVLLAQMNEPDDATHIAKKILEAVRTPFKCNDHEIRISTSIGIALFPEHGRDAELLLKNADIAMYHVKRSGRDNYGLFSSVLAADAPSPEHAAE